MTGNVQSDCFISSVSNWSILKCFCQTFDKLDISTFVNWTDLKLKLVSHESCKLACFGKAITFYFSHKRPSLLHTKETFRASGNLSLTGSNWLPRGPPDLRVEAEWAEWIWGLAVGGSSAGRVNWHLGETFLLRPQKQFQQFQLDHRKKARMICTTMTQMQTVTVRRNLIWSLSSSLSFPDFDLTPSDIVEKHFRKI